MGGGREVWMGGGVAARVPLVDFPHYRKNESRVIVNAWYTVREETQLMPRQDTLPHIHANTFKFTMCKDTVMSVTVKAA